MKYTVDGVPAGRPLGAFLPSTGPAASVRAWKYGMIRVSGHPGDMAISSPKPAALPDGPLMRSAQPSYNSPDVFYPSVYYTSVSNLHPADNTVRVRSTNEMPVPARGTVATPRVAFSRPRVGGLRQVSWPPAPQAWQSVTGAGGG